MALLRKCASKRFPNKIFISIFFSLHEYVISLQQKKIKKTQRWSAKTEKNIMTVNYGNKNATLPHLSLSLFLSHEQENKIFPLRLKKSFHFSNLITHFQSIIGPDCFIKQQPSTNCVFRWNSVYFINVLSFAIMLSIRIG